MEATNKKSPNDFPCSVSNSGDYDTIKSNQVKVDEATVYYNVNISEMNAMHYDKPKTPSQPKDAEKPVVASVAEDHDPLPTSESLSDIQFVVENFYNSQNGTQSNENDPFTPLIVSQQTQPAVNKRLLGQQPPPST